MNLHIKALEHLNQKYSLQIWYDVMPFITTNCNIQNKNLIQNIQYHSFNWNFYGVESSKW